ncbi:MULTISPECIES: hypothetical protein [unclassified Halobacteriovorax]|uniref:aldose epimerase family protein n=1 Tax=unclassified Halobacteriovorax TaxID=2639665 RepID=UPI00399A7D0A
MYTLENDQIKIQIASMGAELKSLYSKTKQKEYLWQGDPKWWGRSAPHLFPRIGYETNEYIEKHNIVKHGYARDTEFVLNEQSSNSLSFKMKDELIVKYELIENSLEVCYEVLVDFPFMIGGHPAFNIDSFPVDLRFSNKCDYYKLLDGVIDKSNSYQIDSEALVIDENIFTDDALVFNNLFKQSQVCLARDLVLSYNSELLGVWSPPGAPFVCIEPWWISPSSIRNFNYSIRLLY